MLELPSALSNEQLAMLTQEPTQEDVTYRKAGRGQEFTYLEAHSVIAAMNEIFGPDGWSHDVHPDFVIVGEVEATDKNGNGLGYMNQIVRSTCTVAIHFKEHTVTHTDVGLGTVTHGSSGPKLENFEKAYKEAATDAFKRAVRVLGNRLGNSLYDKNHPLHKGNGGSSGKSQSRSGSGSSKSSGKSTASGAKSGSFNPSPEGAPEPNGPDGSYVCEICSKPLRDSANYSAAQQAMFSVNQDGRIAHLRCRQNEG